MRVSCSKMSDTSTFLFVILHLLSIALIDDNAHARLEYQVLFLLLISSYPNNPTGGVVLNGDKHELLGVEEAGPEPPPPPPLADLIEFVLYRNNPDIFGTVPVHSQSE